MVHACLVAVGRRVRRFRCICRPAPFSDRRLTRRSTGPPTARLRRPQRPVTLHVRPNPPPLLPSVRLRPPHRGALSSPRRTPRPARFGRRPLGPACCRQACRPCPRPVVGRVVLPASGQLRAPPRCLSVAFMDAVHGFGRGRLADQASGLWQQRRSRACGGCSFVALAVQRWPNLAVNRTANGAASPASAAGYLLR